MKLLGPKACNFLDEQGFTFLSLEEKSRLNISLRITPTLCSIVVAFGMCYQSFVVFAVLSVFGILGTVTKSWQPFDVLHNMLIAPTLKWPKLPPSPAPKRFACFLGFIFLIGGTASFFFGQIFLGDIFGFGYIIAAMLMAITHFCVGSWIFNRVKEKTKSI